MKFICHRGNIENRITNEENKPDKILYCISKKYDVEIDVWKIKNKFYLGHDEPSYMIKTQFLENNFKNLWCHAKNIEALETMLKIKTLNCFWHEKDKYTLTSKGFIWVYPGIKLTKNSICVMPEETKYTKKELKKCYAICTDNVLYYQKED
jgi:hypothetical protein